MSDDERFVFLMLGLTNLFITVFLYLEVSGLHSIEW